MALVKRLHTNSPIFFENPYVLRVEFPSDVDLTTLTMNFGRINRKTYTIVGDTWGYSSIVLEYTRKAKYADPDFMESMRHRAYVCFKDELDALQYRLVLGEKAQKVLIWPTNTRFTIHEVVSTDEP